MLNHRFHVGQKVVFTNEYGVCWGIKAITQQTERSGRPCYHYEGSDTPWFAVEEELLQDAAAEDFVLTAAELQAKYGFATPQAMRDACLDGDPWDGEE